MDINRLKEFIILMELGEFKTAARKLGLSNSAFSKHIKQLESEVGVPLFTRTTRDVEANEFAHLLYPYALEITKTQAMYSAALEDLGHSTHLNIGISSSMFMNSFTNMLLSLTEHRAPFNITLTETNVSNLIARLKADQCDVAFIRNTKKNKNFNSNLKFIPFLTDSMIAVFPNDHQFNNFDTIDIKQLKHEKLLMAFDSSATICYPAEACRDAGFEPDIVYIGPTIHTILHLVSRGVGIAILSGNTGCLEYFPTLKTAKILPEKQIYIDMVYRENNDSPALQYFLKHMVIKYFSNED